MRLFILLAAAAICFSGCKPQPAREGGPGAEHPPGPPSRPDRTTSAPADQNPLEALHHAAMEMSLDAFQFGKPGVGWPADTRAPSASEYLALAVRENHLDPVTAARLGGLRIANTAEDDPLETLLAILPRGKKVSAIRKDGAVAEFESESLVPGFAPLPPREPAWLP